MYKISRAAILASTLAWSGSVFADTIVGDFTLKDNIPNSSGGMVTFSLNMNGTVSATLISTSGNIVGFGFDSTSFNLPESNFSTAVDNAFGWSDIYGSHGSGFFCSSCGTSISWTIGNPGDFTSVNQTLGGGTASTDFFLNSNSQWGANAVAASGVPEASTWTMMLLGFTGLGFASYRSLRNRRAAEA